MKNLIVKLCIRILIKFKVSVILNFKVSGYIQGTSKDCYYYYNDFEDCIVKDLQDHIVDIPHMKKFKISHSI